MAASYDIDRLYRDGVAAIRAGDKAAGREKLTKVVEQDQLHEQAWLWLSACVDTDEERIVCLQNVLTINPRSEAARQGLIKLGGLTSDDEVAPNVSSSSAQSSPSRSAALPPDEQWRAKLVSASAGGKATYISEATLVPGADRPPRTLLDLISAWANALIFKNIGSYNDEVQHSSVTHILINICASVFLQALGVIILVLLLYAVGNNPDSILATSITSLNKELAKTGEINPADVIYPQIKPIYDYLVKPSGSRTAPQISPVAATTFGTFFGVYLLVTILFTFIGVLIQASFVNFVAEKMGGKGDIIRLTLALTIGLVATSIMQIPMWSVSTFVPAVSRIGLIGLAIYNLLQMSNAVSVAHKINILVSIITVFISNLLMGIMAGCFVCGVGFVLSL
ncbi:MAG: YIP1 family protein [Anaerolineae bacterium]|nr:YIP1 family protein [Anaerolineae bacterium]